MIYGCQIWGQRERIPETIQKINNLQDKAIRIINFMPPNAPIAETYKKGNILKLRDYIFLQNTLFIKDFLNNDLPKAFQNYFKKVQSIHNYRTHSSAKNCIEVRNVETTSYGKESVKFQCTKNWNNFQTNHHKDLMDLNRSKAKKELTNYTDN